MKWRRVQLGNLHRIFSVFLDQRQATHCLPKSLLFSFNPSGCNSSFRMASREDNFAAFRLESDYVLTCCLEKWFSKIFFFDIEVIQAVDVTQVHVIEDGAVLVREKPCDLVVALSLACFCAQENEDEDDADDKDEVDVHNEPQPAKKSAQTINVSKSKKKNKGKRKGKSSTAGILKATPAAEEESVDELLEKLALQNERNVSTSDSGTAAGTCLS